MTHPHATDVVIFFHFKGTGVRFLVCGSADCQMKFVFVHECCHECGYTCGADIKIKRFIYMAVKAWNEHFKLLTICPSCNHIINVMIKIIPEINNKSG